jgi:hypothetical protein
MRRSKLNKGFAGAIEGRSKRTTSSGRGFGQESKSVGEEMISRIHKQAGSKERESAEQKEESDVVINRQIESTDTPEPTPTPAAPKVFKEIPEAVIDGLLAQRQSETEQREAAKLDPIKAELAAQKAEMEKIQSELAAEKAKSESLASLGQKYGFTTTPAGVVDQRTAQVVVRSDSEISGKDAYKEYRSLCEQSVRREVRNEAGNVIEHCDVRHSDRFLAENREAVINGAEAAWQEAARGKAGKEAVTARTDIFGAIVETVSALERLTQHPGHIWKNLVDVNVDIGRDSGNGINVLRYGYAQGSTTATDWDLTNVATLTTNAQPVQNSAVKIPVIEYGMGKPGLPAMVNQPIGVSTFLNAISVRDVFNVVSKNLGMNYAQFETAQILYQLLNSTGTTYYNKKGTPTTAPGSIVAGDGGQCDWDFVSGLAAEMATQGIPAFANGKYVLCLTPLDLATLEASLRKNLQILDRASVAELTAIFHQSTNNSDMNFTGYKGDFGDFMVFSTATLAQGPFAAALPANTETIIAPTVMRTGFAIGAHAIGRGIAMPFNIRESDITDFQRQKILAWNSYEGFAALDLHPILSAPGTLVPQQARAFKLRFTSTAK